MPARRKSTGGLTIGFYGTGSMDNDTALKFINDYIEAADVGEEPIRFIFPLTADEWSDNLTDLVHLASNGDIPYEVVTSPDERTRRTFADTIAGAANRHNVEDVIEQMVTILADTGGARLFVLWDDERDDDMQSALARFLDMKIPAFELTDGLSPIGFPTAKEVAEVEAEEATEESAAAPGWSRADLEKKTLAELKEIGASLGVKPRKASATMITDILDAQGTPAEEPQAPETPPEAPVRPQRVKPEVSVPVSPAAVPEDIWERLEKLTDNVVHQLLSGLAEIFAQ